MEQHYPIYTNKEQMYRKTSKGTIRAANGRLAEKELVIEEMNKHQLNQKKKSIQKKINRKTQELKDIKDRINQIKKEIKDLKSKILLIDIYLSKEVQITVATIMTLILLSTFGLQIGAIAGASSLFAQGLLALTGKILKNKSKEKIDFLRIDKNVEMINKKECENSINYYKASLNPLERNIQPTNYQSFPVKNNQNNENREEVHIITTKGTIESNNRPKQYIKNKI